MVCRYLNQMLDKRSHVQSGGDHKIEMQVSLKSLVRSQVVANEEGSHEGIIERGCGRCRLCLIAGSSSSGDETGAG